MLKDVADRSLALGVTHLVFHTYTHNPLDRVPGTSFGSTIGTPFLRGQTWWKHMPHFVDYLGRCTFMLEQGQPVADVIWYLGDDVDHESRQDTKFPSGYHFDYLNADALLTRFEVDQADLVVPEGTRWKVLWLPAEQCHHLTADTVAKIKQLILDGATVIGDRPISNPSLSGGAQADQQFATLVSDLWGTEPASSGDRRLGKGRLIWGDDLRDSLAKLKVMPDVSGTLPERWCHRRVGDTDIYFVVGKHDQAIDANLTFRSQGTPPFWNPIDGSVKPASVLQQSDEGTTVSMQLPASGSTFVVFRGQSKGSAVQSMKHDGTVLFDAADASRVDTSKGYLAFAYSRFKFVDPWISPTAMTCDVVDGGKSLVAWKDGKYEVRKAGGQKLGIEVNGTKTIALQDNWTLEFPSGWDAPSSVTLKSVQPWSELPEKATSHFSGTATYRTSFTLRQLDPGDRFMLDLGQVGDIASIQVNGQDSAVLWAAPYRQDITDLLKLGQNTLSIAVTNTWHNRLTYDESVSESELRTWTFAAPKAKSALTFSGLSQDVSLRIGKSVKLP